LSCITWFVGSERPVYCCRRSRLEAALHTGTWFWQVMHHIVCGEWAPQLLLQFQPLGSCTTFLYLCLKQVMHHMVCGEWAPRLLL
jgi:hypothetical protein